jgi:hypothetical protein
VIGALAVATVAVVVGGLLLLDRDSVSADQAYHTERLEWAAHNAHPELRSGHVVNIHPNGPRNGALERYMVNGADADTVYFVVIVFIDECVGGVGNVGADFGPTGGVIETNAQGDGHSSASFPRAFLDTLPDLGFGPFPVVADVAWQLRVGSDSGEIAYQAPCTTVTIDGPHVGPE